VDYESTAKKARIDGKGSRPQKEKGGSDAECERDVIRVRLTGSQHQENLRHRRDAATHWSKGPKAECYDEYNYSANQPRGNGNSCIDDAIADEHSCGAEAQGQKPPACRARREHRKQSLHGFTVTARRVGGNPTRRHYQLALSRGLTLGEIVVS
jgi:hypothetical protein